MNIDNLFIQLRVYSDYSLGNSVIKIEDLIKHCIDNKIPAVSLTDKYNMFGTLEFAKLASKSGIQPIIGTVLNVQYAAEQYGELLLIAKNEIGFKNLLRLSSNSYLSSSSKLFPAINLENLFSYAEGLIVLCGSIDSPPGKMFYKGKTTQAQQFIAQLKRHLKDNLYIELLRRSDPIEMELEKILLDSALKENIPIVATNGVCFLDASMSEAHDALLCIANSRYILEEDRPKSNPDCYYKTAEEMRALFHDLPEAISNTIRISKRISFIPVGRPPMLPSFETDTNEEEELKRQAALGLATHLKKVDLSLHQKYKDRMEYELQVINSMNFAGYFLIVSDFIKWSKRQDIAVGPGRGSGAGSVVAWSLEITDLDPIKFGLLFERFLNPERVSMPDFDIDFCQERRDEVIEYVRQKYGKDRLAKIITFGKLQARAVLRDVGRVLQMHYNEVDKICKMVPNNPTAPITLDQAIALDKELQELRKSDENIKKLFEISLKLEGINRHASTHAAGVVIADRPLYEIVPLYLDHRGETVLQYSMKMAEEVGLVKFDFLGLQTLTVINWSCKLINKDRSTEDFLNIRDIPLDDELTYQILSKGDTVGIFQFEGAGMREAIKKLKPSVIDDLVALGSLYRPGPMDNIPDYINRKHGLQNPSYIHPKLEETLKETYGIIVYQEQVMEIATLLAGYTPGGADLLRRAMGKKIKSEMEAQRSVFIDGAVKNGISSQRAGEIFDLVEKFASYGFNKSHAAAYAIISYQTAYLKTHYPLEFLVASMNLEIHDTDKINILCQEAKRMNIQVLPPSINYSGVIFIKDNNAIRYGLSAIKNVGATLIEELIKDRELNGKFTSIENFISRIRGLNLNKRVIENLIKSGTLDELNNNRNQLLSNLDYFLFHHYDNNLLKQKSLFEINDIGFNHNLKSATIWNDIEKSNHEFSAFGFHFFSHPLESWRILLNKAHILGAEDLEKCKNNAKTIIAGIVIARKIRSSKKGKYAFIQLSDVDSHTIELCVFNANLLLQYAELLEVGKTIWVEVLVKKDNSGVRYIIESVRNLEGELSKIMIKCNIYLLNKEGTLLLIEKLRENGVPVNLYIKTSTGIHKFRTNKNLYISYYDLELLKAATGVEIVVN